MKKSDVRRMFEERILPTLDPTDKVAVRDALVAERQIRDVPAVREAWVNYVDRLQKDGRITEHQAMTWDNSY